MIAMTWPIAKAPAPTKNPPGISSSTSPVVAAAMMAAGHQRCGDASARAASVSRATQSPLAAIATPPGKPGSTNGYAMPTATDAMINIAARAVIALGMAGTERVGDDIARLKYRNLCASQR